MSTHTIGFYEDLTKIIFELSSKFIKYAPYFFCCVYYINNKNQGKCIEEIKMKYLKFLYDKMLT